MSIPNADRVNIEVPTLSFEVLSLRKKGELASGRKIYVIDVDLYNNKQVTVTIEARSRMVALEMVEVFAQHCQRMNAGAFNTFKRDAMASRKIFRMSLQSEQEGDRVSMYEPDHLRTDLRSLKTVVLSQEIINYLQRYKKGLKGKELSDDNEIVDRTITVEEVDPGSKSNPSNETSPTNSSNPPRIEEVD